MLCSVTLVGIVYFGGYIFNPSESAPVGIWKLDKSDKDIALGDFVFVCPPIHPVLTQLVRDDQLLSGSCDSSTTPFIKKVYGVSGQAMDAHPDHGILIDGELIPNTKPHDWPGLEFTHGQVIKRGEFVALQTDHYASIDSRYFGPIRKSEVIGKIKPVWVR